MTRQRGRVLIIAGSDSGGGAGIQADIKTVTALGGYAATAITALTVQNTLGVTGVHPVPVDFVLDQARAVLDDIGADIIKTGMLGSVELVEAIAELAHEYRDIPFVVDPVMIATSGDVLVADDAIQAIKTRLLPLAAVLTPNVPEAEKLSGLKIENATQQAEAASALTSLGAAAVLVKGGHLTGHVIHDILVSDNVTRVFESERIDSRHTHGTGCTLASGIATGLAKGLDLPRSIEVAGSYLAEAIRRAPGFGVGHGPVNHAWVVDR